MRRDRQVSGRQVPPLPFKFLLDTPPVGHVNACVTLLLRLEDGAARVRPHAAAGHVDFGQ